MSNLKNIFNIYIYIFTISPQRTALDVSHELLARLPQANKRQRDDTNTVNLFIYVNL